MTRPKTTTRPGTKATTSPRTSLTPAPRQTLTLTPPADPAELHAFLAGVLGLSIPVASLLEGSSAPFAYLVHSFFEGRYRWAGGPSARPAQLRGLRPLRHPLPADCAVWASRGGGKTFLGAVATMLDLVFKPGIHVRILGGSLEQSQRMHAHLRRLFDSPFLSPLVAGRITDRRVALRTGSEAQVLAQSQTSVRGSRVQKLRCDEADLFDRAVWEAAQLTTRSLPLPGPWGPVVRGGVEALSTMHLPFGLMWDIVGSAAPTGSAPPTARRGAGGGADPSRRSLFRWGVVDVLESCGPEHSCAGCSLFPECRGRAKDDAQHAEPPSSPPAEPVRMTISAPNRIPGRVPGHVSIDDAREMKARVGESVWQAEMLCTRPRRSDCVYPEFREDLHVGDWPLPADSRAAPSFSDDTAAPLATAAAARCWLGGIDFGFRAPTVILLARLEPDGSLWIEAEHVQSEWTITQHIEHIRAGLGTTLPVPAWFGVDPAGHQRSEQTGVSAVTALRKAGVRVHSRRLELHEGITLVRARLAPAVGAPTLMVHRRCASLIESLQRYHYPPDRPESLEPVKDGFDHAADALRYLVVNLDRPHQTTRSNYMMHNA